MWSWLSCWPVSASWSWLTLPLASHLQQVTSSVFWRGILPADAAISSLVSPWNPPPPPATLHLKEKHMKLRLLVTQIPFPHLCRGRDHLCQGWGQACYSCELLQTELKETLNLSLKSTQSIWVLRLLLFQIRLKEAPLTNTVWREIPKLNWTDTRSTMLSMLAYKLSHRL